MAIPRRRNRLGLLAWLLAIAAIFAGQGLVFLLGVHRADARARHLYDSSLASLELVSWIGRDVAHQRILVDDHIFEHDPAHMRAIEARLADRAADLAKAEAAYAPFVELPNEAETWQRAQESMGRFDAALPDVLALSRQDRDAEARARMAGVLADYAAVDGHIRELLHINRKGASDAVTEILAVQRSAEEVTLITALAGLLALLLLGLWGVRRIASYEARLLEDARLLEFRNRELDAFAGRIAHDLRNPLASMRLTLDLTGRHPADELRAPERLRRGLERIEAMIDDLLALSRLEATEEGQTCRPAAVAAKLEADFAERFSRDADLRTRVEEGEVPCSDGLLRQALWNLLENAVKYRREGVRAGVELQGRLVGAQYELSVSDNGVGMSAGEAVRAFTPYFRAPGTSAVGGLGLGLSIV
ncbi:MAG TPA: ATP-binding protein, partial [Myxococcales bacterium]|nr:ATP-binding protein [Myxococcales bacterium]